MPELTIVIGISGSGKSRYAANVYANRHGTDRQNLIVVSTDALRVKLLRDVNEQGFNRQIHQLADDLTVFHLNKRRNVIFDATNTNKPYLDERIRHILAWTTVGLTLSVVVLQTSVQTAYDRIQRDLDRNRVRANVPFEVIQRQYDDLQETLDWLETTGYNLSLSLVESNREQPEPPDWSYCIPLGYE
jgi:predicted kinase